MAIETIIDRLKRSEGHAITRGLAAYGASEIASRAVRILVVLVIARRTDSALMGAAALSLSLFELIRVLVNVGIGQRIIAATDAELDAICNGARPLFRSWCTGVALLQIGVSAMLGLVFGQQQAAWMLASLSGVYLIMPAGLVPVFLLMRAGRMATTARIGATQTLADHILTMALVLIWPTAWAIVLPKLLTAPIWLILVRRAGNRRANPAAGRIPARHFIRFGAGVLGAELANAARMQCDNLIIGAMLGVNALGLYYFAFNAGLGITTSFVAALGTVLFPHLSAAKSDEQRRARLRSSLLLALGLFLPVVAMQVLLAPIYVPLLFGQRWAPAAPLVSLLGLAAVPMILGSVSSAWLRANGKSALDALIMATAAGMALAGLAIGTRFGLNGAIGFYIGGLCIVLVPVALWLVRPRALVSVTFIKGQLA